jgi:hypothetical protein
MPEPVVALTLLRIGEDLVRLVDLLEKRLGLYFVLRDVGMMLARERPVGALDVALGRLTRYPEEIVIVSRQRSNSP